MPAEQPQAALDSFVHGSIQTAIERLTPGGSVRRMRKAWRVTVKGYPEPCIMFARDAGKARIQVWRDIDDPRVSIIDVTVRREAAADVPLPAPDPMVADLSEAERDALLHAFGLNRSDPVKAGYRSHYYTERDNPVLVRLAGLGLMRTEPRKAYEAGLTYFLLTDYGKHVALSMVPLYPD